MSHYSSQLNIKFNPTITGYWYNQAYGVYNIDVYIDTCHDSCTTCYGPSALHCLSCPVGANLIDTQCLCTNSRYTFQQTCVSKCPSGYLPDESFKTCNQEQRLFNVLSLMNYLNYAESDTLNFTTSKVLKQRITHCSLLQIFGGYKIFQNISISTSKQNLPYHNKLRVSIEIYKIDSWSSRSIYLKVDNQIVYQQQFADNTNPEYLCGNENEPDQFQIIDILINHKNSDISLELFDDIPLGSTSFWGMKNFLLEVMQCTQFCENCLDDVDCLKCQSGYKLLDGRCVETCLIFTNDTGDECIDPSLEAIAHPQVLYRGLD